MAVTVSNIISSVYTIDFALAERLQRSLTVTVWDRNTANLLVRASVHTLSNTYLTSLSQRGRVGERQPVHAVPGISLPYGTRVKDATCSVTKAPSCCMHPWQYTCSESWLGQSTDAEWGVRHCILPEGRLSWVLWEGVQAPRL